MENLIEKRSILTTSNDITVTNTGNDGATKLTITETFISDLKAAIFKEFAEKEYVVGAFWISDNEAEPNDVIKEKYGVDTSTWEWEQITDRVLMCRGSTYTSTGGAASVTLSTSNLPSHSHSFSWSGTTVTGGSHTHSTSCSTDGSHTHGTEYSTLDGGSYKCVGAAPSQNTRYDMMLSAGSHSHTITIDYAETHTHSYSGSGTTNSTGSGSSFSIIPPYRATYVWVRTK